MKSEESKTLNIDQNFGNWPDPVSKFMYHDHFEQIYSDDRFALGKYSKIEDFGGANGKLKEFFGNRLTTVDIDETNDPDYVGNIVNYNGVAEFHWRGQIARIKIESDLIIIRYVLHYLTDEQIIQMFQNLKKHHKGDILIIQFTNEDVDMKTKKQNSVNETKYFRTTKEIQELVKGFQILAYDVESFDVTAEFYRNRLQNFEAQPHGEQIHTILIN